MKKLYISLLLLCGLPTLTWADDNCTPPENASECLSEGLASAYKDQGKKTFWGFVDANGKTVIPFKYQSVGTFKEGIASATLNNKTGMIDKTGKTIVPFKFKQLGVASEGLIAVEAKGKQGFIDKTGKVVIPLTYDADQVGAEGNQLDTWASLDNNYFSEGLSAVKKGKKWGFIDRTGKTVIPFKYDHVGAFSEGLAEVMMGDNQNIGFINKTGKLVIPAMYRSYFEESTFYQPALFKNGKAKLKGEMDENGNSICINRQNQPVQCD